MPQKVDKCVSPRVPSSLNNMTPRREMGVETSSHGPTPIRAKDSIAFVAQNYDIHDIDIFANLNYKDSSEARVL